MLSRVFVTGVAGFIGCRLAARLAAAGHEVLGSVRRPADARVARPGVAACHVLRLEDSPAPGLFRDIDTLVHLAFDLAPGRGSANLDGTLRLVQAARDSGVRRQLFVSSYSAGPQAVTEYGRTKWAIERRLPRDGMTIVRPGLVVGAGGLFGRLIRVMVRWPVVPLVDGGTAQVPVVAVKDLLEALATLVAAEGGGEHNVFLPELVSLRRIIDELQRLLRRRRLILNVPSRALVPLLDLAAALKLPLPVRADNVRALAANQDVVCTSTLEALVADPQPLDQMISAALKEYRA